MLNIQKLSKSYGPTQVLYEIDLALSPGDICAFIGANGSGKTTTIKSAIGLIPFESGQVHIGGHSIKKDPVACKEVLAYVPDNPDIYPFMRGIDYLNFIGDVYQVPLERRKEAIETYGQGFALYDRLGDRVDQYSHGMQQKLALMAALLHQPKLIILDEPFVGLDPIATRFIREEFIRLAKEEATTILFSTHVLEVAERLCNKVAIIAEGRLHYFGDTQTALEKGSLEDLFIERTRSHE